MPEITFRPATDDDLPALTDLARRIWTMGLTCRLEQRFGPLGGQPWDHWTAQDIGSALAASLACCLVAEVDGQLAGWVTWSVNPERETGQIGYNGVDPTYRGLGLGTALVEQALDALRAAGVRLAIVVTGLDDGHAAARRVYEKCGFEPFHQFVTYVQELTHEHTG
jgi:GNAT superfamily N-acetyltransferase